MVGGEEAGIGHGMDRLRRTIDVNVTAACSAIREAIETMIMTTDDNHKGHILLINRLDRRHNYDTKDRKSEKVWIVFCFFRSILGHRIPDVPVPMFNIYPATKFALNGLAQTFRQELRFHGGNIKFTVSVPGWIEIPLRRVPAHNQHLIILHPCVSAWQCISPGMVDTDMLSTAFPSGGLSAIPKLRTEDVLAAVMYALETPPSVQVRWRTGFVDLVVSLGKRERDRRRIIY